MPVRSGLGGCEEWTRPTWKPIVRPTRTTRPMAANEMLGEMEDSALAADSDRQSIVIELLHDDAQPPRRATSGSAGYDLCAYLTGRTVDCSDGQRQWKEIADSREDGARITLPGQAMALIPLGFKARLPNGFEAQIRPRSGATSSGCRSRSSTGSHRSREKGRRGHQVASSSRYRGESCDRASQRAIIRGAARRRMQNI